MGILEYIRLAFLFSLQYFLYTAVSRARNRNILWWIFLAAIINSSVYIIVVREIIKRLDDIPVLILFVISSAFGSTFGVFVNMKIEKRIGAKADN